MVDQQQNITNTSNIGSSQEELINWEELYPNSQERAIAQAKFEALQDAKSEMLASKGDTEKEINLIQKTWNTISGANKRLDNKLVSLAAEMQKITSGQEVININNDSAQPSPVAPSTTVPVPPQPASQTSTPKPTPAPVLPPQPTPAPPVQPTSMPQKPAPAPQPAPQPAPTPIINNLSKEEQLKAAQEKEKSLHDSPTATAADIANVQKEIQDLKKEIGIREPEPKPIIIEEPTPEPAPIPTPVSPIPTPPTPAAPPVMTPPIAKPVVGPVAPTLSPTINFSENPVTPVQPLPMTPLSPINPKPIPKIEETVAPTTPTPMPAPPSSLPTAPPPTPVNQQPIPNSQQQVKKISLETRLYRTENDIIDALGILDKGKSIYDMGRDDYGKLHITKAIGGGLYLVFGDMEDPGNPYVAYFSEQELSLYPSLTEAINNIMTDITPRSFSVAN